MSLTTVVHHPLRLRRLTVVALDKPTPRLRRVTLAGPDMDGFVSASAEDHVKVFFPQVDGELIVPEFGPGGPRWPTSGPRPLARDYTPRRFDANELVLDIVLHDGGVASGWAERARLGDVVGVAGPRGSHVVDPSVRGFLLAADETGLPALARRLEELPAGAEVAAAIEVLDGDDEQELTTAAEVVAVRWVHRASGGRLADAVRGLPLPAGPCFAWAAGEAASVNEIRRYWLDDLGLDPDTVSARGYWRAGVVDHQELHED